MRETEGESAGVTAEVTPSLGLIFNLLSNLFPREIQFSETGLQADRIQPPGFRFVSLRPYT